MELYMHASVQNLQSNLLGLQIVRPGCQSLKIRHLKGQSRFCHFFPLSSIGSGPNLKTRVAEKKFYFIEGKIVISRSKLLTITYRTQNLVGKVSSSEILRCCVSTALRRIVKQRKELSSSIRLNLYLKISFNRTLPVI